jgi:hypothetical protein
MSKRVYIASKFARQAEMRGIARDLERHGIEVVSRWLDSPHPVSGEDLEDPDVAGQLASMDFEDLRSATLCLAFTEPAFEDKPGRGGRHTELGIALGLGREVWLVGPREHVFHALPDVVCFADWESAAEALLADAKTVSGNADAGYAATHDRADVNGAAARGSAVVDDRAPEVAVYHEIFDPDHNRQAA